MPTTIPMRPTLLPEIDPACIVGQGGSGAVAIDAWEWRGVTGEDTQLFARIEGVSEA